MIGGKESPQCDVQKMTSPWNPFFPEGFVSKISDTAGKIYALFVLKFVLIIDLVKFFISIATNFQFLAIFRVGHMYFE